MNSRINIEKVETLSKLWSHLRRFTLTYLRRDGTKDTLIREIHDHGHGAAVLPYDSKRRTILLVRQFRLPVYLFNGSETLLEACAGLLDGQSPEDCVRNEALEELGYRITHLRQVAAVFSSPGAVTENITLFLAEYSADDKINEGGGRSDEGEDIEVIEMSLKEALAMLAKGEIQDAKTVMLLLSLERELHEIQPYPTQTLSP